MDQSEDRGHSIALKDSWQIFFALSFIYLLGLSIMRTCHGSSVRHIATYLGNNITSPNIVSTEITCLCLIIIVQFIAQSNIEWRGLRWI